MNLLKKISHYMATSKIGWKVGIKYRFNFFITTLTTPLNIIIFYFLWKAIFDYTGIEIIKGFTFNAMIQYYVLSMIVGFFIWAETDKWIAQDVRRGHIVSMFIVPVRFMWQHLAFEAGINFLGVILNLIPVFLIGFLFFGLNIAPVFYFTSFLVSVVLAFLLAFFLSFNLGLTAFWMKRITGLRRVKRALGLFLGGGMIPLTFFPESVQKILHFLPFEYTRYVPINIYLGNYSVSYVFLQLGLQVAWILALYLLSVFVYKRAFRQFAGAGV
ncbi:ABC-2 family transporter protein [Candidatus Woesearchaeota archaeon]|nr:ABC-2 family transporter protein [Candidatus Woesearchaeota archaeon]